MTKKQSKKLKIIFFVLAAGGMVAASLIQAVMTVTYLF